jgi:hypothetical protein
MKDGRILGGCTRKSYGLLHARASCCELADELTLAQISNKMKHVSQAQIELHALQKSATSKCFRWSRAKHSRNLRSASKLVCHKATRKRFSGNSGRRRPPTHFVAVTVLVTASFIFSRNT